MSDCDPEEARREVAAHVPSIDACVNDQAFNPEPQDIVGLRSGDQSLEALRHQQQQEGSIRQNSAQVDNDGPPSDSSDEETDLNEEYDPLLEFDELIDEYGGQVPRTDEELLWRRGLYCRYRTRQINLKQ